MASGVDGDAVMGEDVFVVIPSIEGGPVVGSDQEGEFAFGFVLCQVLQCAPGVGGGGKVELVVGGVEAGFVCDGGLDDLESPLVVEQIVALAFKRVLGGDDEPHLVQFHILEKSSG